MRSKEQLIDRLIRGHMAGQSLSVEVLPWRRTIDGEASGWLRGRIASQDGIDASQILSRAGQQGLRHELELDCAEQLLAYAQNAELARLSVPMSQASLRIQGVEERFDELLARYQIQRGQVCLEIQTVDEPHFAPHLRRVCAAFHDLGCQLALDRVHEEGGARALCGGPGFDYFRLSAKHFANIPGDVVEEASIAELINALDGTPIRILAEDVSNSSQQRWLAEAGVAFFCNQAGDAAGLASGDESHAAASA